MAYATIIRGDTRQSYTALAKDGSSFFIPYTLYKSFFLKEGQELNEVEFLSLREKVLYKVTYDKALALIARRDHGQKELCMKLIQKGFDKDFSDKVTLDLREKHIIDDVRFAYQYIISRQRKSPEGIPLLRMRLKQKMISSSDIEKAVNQYLEDDTYFAAIQIAIKRLQRKNTPQEKLITTLIKKGFNKRDIFEVLSDIEKE